MVQKKSHSKYIVNHNIFQEDTEESFYLAGFIAADGCVRISKTNKLRDYLNYRLQISLSKKDKKHLEMVKSLLGSTHPIHDYLIKNSKKNKCWNDVWESKLLITSKQIVQDLEKFNIFPRKSLTYEFPEWMKFHPFKRHFIRGYIDGDGSFYRMKNSNDIVLGIRGTIQFLQSCKDIFEKECMIQTNAQPALQSGIGNLRIHSNEMVSRIMRYLYSQSSIYMERKFKKALQSVNILKETLPIKYIESKIRNRNKLMTSFTSDYHFSPNIEDLFTRKLLQKLCDMKLIDLYFSEGIMAATHPEDEIIDKIVLKFGEAEAYRGCNLFMIDKCEMNNTDYVLYYCRVPVNIDLHDIQRQANKIIKLKTWL